MPDVSQGTHDGANCQRSLRPRLRARQLRIRPDRQPRRSAEPLGREDGDLRARPAHAPRRRRGRRPDRRRLRPPAQVPTDFLRAIGREQGFRLAERFAAGAVFLSQDEAAAARARGAIDKAVREIGLEVAGWRAVPTNASACGELALKTLPRIEQVFVNAPAGMPTRPIQPPPVPRASPRRKPARWHGHLLSRACPR